MFIRLLTVAAAATLAATAAAAAGNAASVSRCATSGLVVWLKTGDGNAGAGSFFVTLELTNLSGHRCSLLGYPGVSAVDLAGHALGSAASRNPRTTPRTAVLAPGGSASSVLQINDTGVFPSGACRPVTAAGLRVFPPGATASKIVPFAFRACSRTGRAYLHVEAVKAEG
jgi:hypothetical protein